MTLSKAVSIATTPGDIIHIGDGIHIIEKQCLLASGVSIEGNGDTSIIKSNVQGDVYSILCESPYEGSEGGAAYFKYQNGWK